MDLRWAPLCALLCALPALADPAPAYLVKDINATATSNFGIGNIADTGGGIAYLSAGRPASGTELWTTDGTPAGTRIVKDLYSGTGDSSPSPFVRLGSSVLFAATHPTTGRELWQSDGSAAGTVRVKDIVPGPVSSSPSSLTIANGTLFFGAADASGSHELWKSDGTDAGTVLVSEVGPSPGLYTPSALVNANGTLFFLANLQIDLSGLWSFELWTSDGTSAGTEHVIGPLLGLSELTGVGDRVFFSSGSFADGAVWTSDGTSAGTVPLLSIWWHDQYGEGFNFTAPLLTRVGSTLLFFSAGTGGGTNRELWKSDGTAAGTVQVKDIVPGSAGSFPEAFRNVNGTLFFRAFESATGYELWKSDGRHRRG